MDFDLSDEQQAIRTLARDFATGEAAGAPLLNWRGLPPTSVAWLIMRSRRIVMLACVLALWPSGAKGNGGSGKVGPLRVGPLRIHQATDVQVREWAGKPSRRWVLRETGRRDYLLWRYRHRYGRQTSYAFARLDGEWLFEEFFTSSRRFLTRRGTRARFSYARARRHEPGARYHQPGCFPARLSYFKEGGFRLELFLSAKRPRGRVTGLSVEGPLALGCY
jgi:hypothetical protein